MYVYISMLSSIKIYNPYLSVKNIETYLFTSQRFIYLFILRVKTTDIEREIDLPYTSLLPK